MKTEKQGWSTSTYRLGRWSLFIRREWGEDPWTTWQIASEVTGEIVFRKSQPGWEFWGNLKMILRNWKMYFFGSTTEYRFSTLEQAVPVFEYGDDELPF